MSLPQPTKKQAAWIWLSLTTLAVTVFLALIGLFLMAFGWLLNRVSAVLMPLALALVLAYILDPVVEFLVRKKIGRVWSITIVFAALFLALAGLFFAVVPNLVRETNRLTEEFPENMNNFQQKADHFLENNPIGKQVLSHWQFDNKGMPGGAASNDTSTLFPTNQGATNLTVSNQATAPTHSVGRSNAAPVVAKANNETNQQNRLIPNSTNGLPAYHPHDSSPSRGILIPGIQRVLFYSFQWFAKQLGKLGTWAEFILGFILTPLYLFYFLLEKETITRYWTRYVPLKDSRMKRETIFILREINQHIIVFFRGQVLVALCVAVMLIASYSLMGLNYGALIGLVGGLLDIVPYLGTLVGLVLALTVSGFQYGDWQHPLLVFGIAATVKMLEDLVISPRIMGHRTGLHPMVVILAVMFGTTLLGGFTGALVAIPLTAALRTLMFRYVWKKGNAGNPHPQGQHEAKHEPAHESHRADAAKP